MLKDLWDIAQALVGMKDSFKKAQRDRKDRIAEYFTTTGTIIQEAADIFKKGDVPHGKCQQMLDQAQYFTEVVGDTIDKNKAGEFQKKLIESHEVEMLASEVLGKENAKEKIIELEKIAGSFLALGMAIKAGR
jgi:hypothetical protein